MNLGDLPASTRRRLLVELRRVVREHYPDLADELERERPLVAIDPDGIENWPDTVDLRR